MKFTFSIFASVVLLSKYTIALLPKDDRYEILIDAETNGEAQVSSTNKDRKVGRAILNPVFVQKIKADAGLNPFVVEADDDHPNVQTTYLSSTSDEHVDCVMEMFKKDKDWRKDQRVITAGFIPLRTNKDAYFDIDETCYSIEEGSLVTFNGSSHHKTVINSGTVSLIGPFQLPSMKMIGMLLQAEQDSQSKGEKREKRGKKAKKNGKKAEKNSSSK